MERGEDEIVTDPANVKDRAVRKLPIRVPSDGDLSYQQTQAGILSYCANAEAVVQMAVRSGRPLEKLLDDLDGRIGQLEALRFTRKTDELKRQRSAVLRAYAQRQVRQESGSSLAVPGHATLSMDAENGRPAMIRYVNGREAGAMPIQWGDGCDPLSTN